MAPETTEAGWGFWPASCFSLGAFGGSEDLDIPALRDIFVVGASRGGVPALRNLASQLPRDLRASVFVVLHTAPDREGGLATVLARDARLPVRYAWDGERFTHGEIYLAPPDRHLLLEPETLRLTRGPREYGVRPAIDPLFRSAAAHHGPRVVGILLTGLRSDGAAGLEAIRRAGGLAVVQDPADAAFAEMPRSALDRVAVDHVLPLAEIGAKLALFAGEPARSGTGAPDDVVREARIDARFDESCEDADGSLAVRFESSLLVAVRALEERARILDRLAEQSTARSIAAHAERFARDRDEALAHAQVLRELLGSLDRDALSSALRARR